MKNLILGLLFGLLFSLVGFGQEAYVVSLKPDDAMKAKATYDKLQQAQKDWADTQKHIALKYLIVEPTDPEASDKHYVGETDTGINISSSGTLSSGNLALRYITTIGGNQSEPTKEEIAQETKEEKAYIERFNREKRQRKGFDGNCSNCLPKFEFTHDFKFIVPSKPEVKAPVSPFYLSPAAKTLTTDDSGSAGLPW